MSRVVADQMIALAIIFQIVVTAEPGHAHEIALGRHEGRGAAHPAQHDIGAEIADLARQERLGDEIERTTKAQLQRIEPGFPQTVHPAIVAADDDRLLQPGAVQRHDQTLEEGLGAAMRLPRHRLQDAQRPHRETTWGRAARASSAIAACSTASTLSEFITLPVVVAAFAISVSNDSGVRMAAAWGPHGP